MKLKKGLTLVNALIIVFVIFFAVVLGVWFFSPDKEKAEVEKRNNEAQDILNANKEAVENGQTNNSKILRNIDETDHILGEKGAPVELIIYSDFECPFCANFASTIKEVKSEFGEKVVIAFRHFPLTRLHDNALDAAIASECAAEQGKFWEMHDKLFADNSVGTMAVAQFKRDADSLGMDIKKFDECLDAKKYEDKVTREMQEAANIGVTGTPASFVNGKVVIGAYPFEDFTDSSGLAREGMKSIINKLVNSN